MYIVFIKNGSLIKNRFWKLCYLLPPLLLRKINFYSKNCSVRAHCLLLIFLININLYLDQEVYDFIDPSTEDTAVPEQGNAHIVSFVSFLKVKKILKQY